VRFWRLWSVGTKVPLCATVRGGILAVVLFTQEVVMYDDGYDPYGPRGEDDCFENDYDYYMSDYKYQRSMMTPYERAVEDLREWVHCTRLYRKWSNWKYRRSRPISDDESIPF